MCVCASTDGILRLTANDHSFHRPSFTQNTQIHVSMGVIALFRQSRIDNRVFSLSMSFLFPYVLV